MLRLHFSGHDLARTRIAAGPDPLWEVVLSTHLLGNRDGPAMFDPWRAQAREALRPLPGWMPRLLRTVAPAHGDFPDFLTPQEGQQGLTEGIEAVLRTPRGRLRRELLALGPLSDHASDLVRGDTEALRALGAALRTYHDTALRPHWPRLATQAEADRSVRARAFTRGGVEAVLNSFRPLLRWRPPVLEADYPLDRDLHLGGRGLLLIPSVFCWRRPVTLVDPRLPPVLVYPVARTADWWSGPTPEPGRDRLAGLLGVSRAAILRAAADGCSAGELARRAAASPAAASHHLRVLREAGLVTATRRGTTILYSLTPVGHALLAENPAA